MSSGRVAGPPGLRKASRLDLSPEEAASFVADSVANSSGLKSVAASGPFCVTDCDLAWIDAGPDESSSVTYSAARPSPGTRPAASLLAKPGPSMARASSMRRRNLPSAARARAGSRPSSVARADSVPGADSGGERDAFQRLHGGFADAARGRVDHAAQRDGVVRVEDELEVAEDVLDLGAVVEGEAADHAVLDLVAAQGLFKQARLRVGAVEDGAARRAFAGAGVGGAEVLLDAVGDKQRLVLAVGGLVDSRSASRPRAW